MARQRVRRKRRRRRGDAQPGTLAYGLQDPDYDKNPDPWPRLGVNHERPYKHPDEFIEKLARRLYRIYCKSEPGQRYLPWRLLDPPTDEWRHSSHSGNGRIRARWYRIAEAIRGTILCPDCEEGL